MAHDVKLRKVAWEGMIDYCELEWEHVLQQINWKGEQTFKNFQHSLKSSSCGLCVCDG
jgi:hypothetical protein